MTRHKSLIHGLCRRWNKSHHQLATQHLSLTFVTGKLIRALYLQQEPHENLLHFSQLSCYFHVNNLNYLLTTYCTSFATSWQMELATYSKHEWLTFWRKFSFTSALLCLIMQDTQIIHFFAFLAISHMWVNQTSWNWSFLLRSINFI